MVRDEDASDLNKVNGTRMFWRRCKEWVDLEHLPNM